MAGTQAGGRKAMATNRTRYGINFPEVIGRMGGNKRAALNHDGTGRGFARDDTYAAEMGKRGSEARTAAFAKRRHSDRT